MAIEASVDPTEISKFEAMAAEWWNPEGKFKPLHMLNPCRIDYIMAQVAEEFDRELNQSRPFEGLSILDIGCGGGLLSEPMARLGATVMGVDAAGKNISVAQAHASQSKLNIEYRHTTAEQVADEGQVFDVILNMEVIEHVADPISLLTTCRHLMKPDAIHICSTINRNMKSYAVAIVGAERVAKWLPKGTHDWNKFITPDELYSLLIEARMTPVDRKGFVFNPLEWGWRLSDRDLSVNYVTTSRRSE